jgi:hypothetical protein
VREQQIAQCGQSSFDHFDEHRTMTVSHAVYSENLEKNGTLVGAESSFCGRHPLCCPAYVSKTPRKILCPDPPLSRNQKHRRQRRPAVRARPLFYLPIHSFQLASFDRRTGLLNFYYRKAGRGTAMNSGTRRHRLQLILECLVEPMLSFSSPFPETVKFHRVFTLEWLPDGPKTGLENG